MPSEGRRLHGFAVVSRALRLGRQLALPAIVGGASIGEGLGSVVQWMVVILAVPPLLIAVAHWWAFRFRLEQDDLVIDSGIFARRRRVIPLARVQNIDLEQNLLERLFGVAELRLETASGGKDTEASLQVLALDEAQELQAELMRRRGVPARPGPSGAAVHRTPAWAEAGQVTGEADDGHPAATHQETAGAAPSTPRPRVLLQLGLSDLALAGATSNEAALIAAGLATLLEVGSNFLGLEALMQDIVTQGAGMGLMATILMGTAVAVAFIVGGWLASIAATMVRFYGFTLTRVGDDLKREYGLFSRHRSTVPIERVQAVRVEETLLRRPLGLTAMKIETAGAGPQQGSDRPGGRAEAFVPLARRRDVGRLLSEVFEDARFDGVRFNPVAPVSRSRSFRRLAIPVLIATVVLIANVGRAGAALVLLVVPAWFLARAQYRARAWARTPGHTLVRGGVLTRATWVIPEHKVQTLHLSENPFQRRHGIGTLMVDTAAGGRVARVVDVERQVGTGLLVAVAADGEADRKALVAGGRPSRVS